MPHPIRQYLVTGLGMIRAIVPERFSSPVVSTARWSKECARRWYDETGWLLGCNFVPSTAGNQLEMWQAATFDTDTIDRELSWAAGLGMNAINMRRIKTGSRRRRRSEWTRASSGGTALRDLHQYTTSPIFL